MPKLKQYKEIAPELMSWMSFFKKSENVSSPIEIEEIHDAYEKMLSIGGNKVYLDYLEAREKYEIDAAAKRRDAEKELNKLREKDKREGLAKRLAEGKHEKAIETAKKMLSKGLDCKTISECTGLSVDEILNL